MQATVQSNLFTSSEAPYFSSDKLSSVQLYGVSEIGVINGIRKILVPINQRAVSRKAWGKHRARELTLDESLGVNQLWIEVIPPNQTVALQLNIRTAEENQLDRNDDSVVYLDCFDFQRTYNELTHRGATFVAAPVKTPFGWLSMFEDGDGRRYVLGRW
jgi:hypothetical protein